jgi:hypothetical protein
MFHHTECETSNSQQQSGKKPKFDSKSSVEILPATHRFANGQDKARLLKVLFETIDRLEKNS